VLLAELLAAAPPELAAQVAAELRAVGLDRRRRGRRLSLGFS
jgi:hypothetical protein